MDVLVYEDAVNPAWWLNRIAQSDWIAGQYLHTLLTENRFHKEYGDKARLLLLADGTKLAAFCTYAEGATRYRPYSTTTASRLCALTGLLTGVFLYSA